MTKMMNSGLILEGGGMRGIFTAGVLDFLMDQEIMFSDIYGVSAGACHAVSYISNQRHRSFETNIDYLDEDDYCSIKNLIKTGNLFGVDMMFQKIPSELKPLDYETFRQWPGRFYAVITDVETGKAVYHQVKDMSYDAVVVRASASLPLLANIVRFEGHKYLDGGIADSIPIRKSMADGHAKNVVVLTQDVTYRKGPSKMMPMIRKHYKEYPAFIESAESRYLVYNDTVEYLIEQEALGNVFIIRPEAPVTVGRTEKNEEKLKELYVQGYEAAKKHYEAMLAYLQDT